MITKMTVLLQNGRCFYQNGGCMVKMIDTFDENDRYLRTPPKWPLFC